jgi:eukaryotic-like serine/threonine-protein kinase
MNDESKNPVLEQQLRWACAELDRRRRHGDPCRAEQLFTIHPGLADSEETAIELIYTEFVVREQLGEHVEAAEYLRRFPQWARMLARQFEVHQALHNGNGHAPATGVPAIAASSEPPDLRPRYIGPYEILAELARGAMGVIYKAQHQMLQRTVALKMVLAGAHASPTALARFHTEAEAAARLQHPNIVQIYDVGSFEGRPYLALEYIEGGSLASRLTGQPQEPRRAALLLQTVAAAVEYAHRRGIVHRDLKPGNILLERHGPEKDELGTPKVADFGLAKLLDRGSPQTESGTIFGTPSYMAPEQAQGHNRTVGAAADVYALGAILYELLTGRPPFRADNMLATLQQVASEDPVPPERLQADLPPDLATICMKCLHKDPARRYATAGALATDLQRFLCGEPIMARPVSVWERGWKWACRRPSLAALAAAVTVAAMALLTVSLWYNARLGAALTVSDQRSSEVR